jgi:hypothetical protein
VHRVSLDMDGLDPVVAPGVGTLTAALAAELAASAFGPTTL